MQNDEGNIYGIKKREEKKQREKKVNDCKRDERQEKEKERQRERERRGGKLMESARRRTGKTRGDKGRRKNDADEIMWRKRERKTKRR